jgi:hypothetical protein
MSSSRRDEQAKDALVRDVLVKSHGVAGVAPFFACCPPER